MVVFEEYLRSKSALSVLFQPEYFDLKIVQNYLKSKPEFAWMVDIKNRQYENVDWRIELIIDFIVDWFLGITFSFTTSCWNDRQTSSRKNFFSYSENEPFLLVCLGTLSNK